MSMEQIVRIALLAYPAEVRGSRGGEMLATALDTSEGSAMRRLRESLALIGAGLRTRANVSAAVGTRRLAADICAQGATAFGLLTLIGLLHLYRYLTASQARLGATSIAVAVLLAAAVAAALIGYDRVAAVLGFSWIGVALQSALASPWSAEGSAEAVHWAALMAVPAACYITMLIRPRARPRRVRRLLWLAAAVLLGLALSPYFPGPGYGLGLGEMASLALLLAGLFLLPADPILPLAFAIALIAKGLAVWTTLGGLPLSGGQWAVTAAGPMLLAGSALRLVSVRRHVAS